MSRRGAMRPGRGDPGIGADVILVTLLLVASVVALVPAAAQAQGSISGGPDISVVGPDRGFDPGEDRNLSLYLQNDPRIDFSSASEASFERVTTARAVRVAVEDGNAPVTVRSGTIAVGTVPAGQTPVNVAISVDEDAEPGTYRLPVQVRYRATNYISEVGGSTTQVSRVERTTVTIEILEGSRFRLDAVGGGVRAGDRTTVAVTMANVGEADANEATVTFRPAGGGIGLVDGDSSVVDVATGPPGRRAPFPWPSGPTARRPPAGCPSRQRWRIGTPPASRPPPPRGAFRSRRRRHPRSPSSTSSRVHRSAEAGRSSFASARTVPGNSRTRRSP